MTSLDELNKLLKQYEESKEKEVELKNLIFQLSQELASDFDNQFPPLRKVDCLIFHVSTVSRWLEEKRGKRKES